MPVKSLTSSAKMMTINKLSAFKTITSEIEKLQQTPEVLPISSKLILQYTSKRLLELEPELKNVLFYYAYDGFDDSCNISGFTMVDSNLKFTNFEIEELINALRIWYLQSIEDEYMRSCNNEGSLGYISFELDGDSSSGINISDEDIKIRDTYDEYKDFYTINYLSLNFVNSEDTAPISVHVLLREYDIKQYDDLFEPLVKKLQAAVKERYPSLLLFEAPEYGARTAVCRNDSAAYETRFVDLDLEAIWPGLPRYNELKAIVYICSGEED